MRLTGEKGERGDASFVNNTIKGSLTYQNNVPAPMSSGNTAESLQGQCAA
jgi:hypothetical protein